jgi:NAD(P)H-hydrate epimerase
MQPVLTPTEMGEADQRTIAAGTPVDVLMERAGTAVAWAIRRRRAPYGLRAVIVCGKGNNGGDGLVTARVLRQWGAVVDVFELADGIDRAALHRALTQADVAIDAMYGTGFRGELTDDAAAVADELFVSTCDLVVAVDIPSGVDGLTGAIEGNAIDADLTVTFAARKPGLLLVPGRDFAGEVMVADIGIDIGVPRIGMVEDSDIFFSESRYRNKWDSGLLLVGGSSGMTGAPLLVSHAATRAGAGIVWCGVPGKVAAMIASGSEVIMKSLPATADGALAGLDDLLDSADRFCAVAVGPGLGTAHETQAAVRELVENVRAPMVLDADGLNAFAGAPRALRARPGPTVLTPHDGEYARLMGERVATDRIEAARRLAQESECVVLLKGPTTVIVEPEHGEAQRVAISTSGGAALATAGSGDVLTGIIGGFLARGAQPFAAASWAAHVHGRAADVAGHTGLVAGDLVAALPRTLDELEH